MSQQLTLALSLQPFLFSVRVLTGPTKERYSLISDYGASFQMLLTFTKVCESDIKIYFQKQIIFKTNQTMKRITVNKKQQNLISVRKGRRIAQSISNDVLFAELYLESSMIGMIVIYNILIKQQVSMGQYRSQPQKTKQTALGESKRLNFVATGMCGWRNYMQDAHISKATFAGSMSLFAVFDGHGGGEVARFTEKHFAEQLVNNENFQKKKFEQALTETFLKMDRMLQTVEGQKELKKIKKDLVDKQNSEDNEDSYAGCTAVVALVTENEIYVANAGDSRCVIATGGKAEAMSFDHKPDNEKELARIKKAGGEVFEGRVNGNLNLSRAIGDLEYKNNSSLKPEQQLISSKPDVLKKPLAGVDYLVMGCDGIFEIKTNQEIIDMVVSRMAKKTLKDTAEEILDALLAPSAQNEYGLDNMTLIIVRFKN